jgi:hypothetical protein
MSRDSATGEAVAVGDGWLVAAEERLRDALAIASP